MQMKKKRRLADCQLEKIADVHSKIATVWQDANWQICSVKWVQFPGHNPMGLGRILVLGKCTSNGHRARKYGWYNAL